MVAFVCVKAVRDWILKQVKVALMKHASLASTKKPSSNKVFSAKYILDFSNISGHIFFMMISGKKRNDKLMVRNFYG